jgi:hypothetical protein
MIYKHRAETIVGTDKSPAETQSTVSHIQDRRHTAEVTYSV